MKTIACLIPLSWDYVPSQFLFSWSGMLMAAKDRYHLLMVTSRAASVARMQQRMVDDMLQMNVDYILHLDADQTYPSNTPDILRNHIDCGKDIVAGLVPRREAGGCNVYNLTDDNRLKQINAKPDSGLIQVECTGFGGMMVNPEVYRQIERPFFGGLPIEYGPDLCFYKKVKDKGIKAWCDTNLKFGHIVPRVKYP